MKRAELILGLSLSVALTACSSIYPLGSVARRTANPYSLEQDVSVDTTRGDNDQVKHLAWAAYSVTFDCPKNCPYSTQEREALAAEIAERSFQAFDREIRQAFGAESSAREVQSVAATVGSPAFAPELKTNSYKTTVSRWVARLGLSRAAEVNASAQGLKSVNPSELGWSGGQSLASLGKALGVDGVLVGHILVTPSEDSKEPRRLVIRGPKIWLFSSTSEIPLAVAGLRPTWRLDPMLRSGATELVQPARLSAAKELRELRYDWSGIDVVANGFSQRIARALQE
ncbi:MAG: hypothetical protein HY074_01265 [Deltaproteobacteria bacterium]|nr:hypothetical protein [Deltaproteobacteria bacterium]